MFLFSYLNLLLSILDKKIIDYNVCPYLHKPTDIYDSVILCKDFNFKLIELVNQQNIIYTYEEKLLSPYSYNFLLTYLSNKYEYSIVTTKENYFKPFQYNIQDILLVQLKKNNEDIIDNGNNVDTKLILTKKMIEKNSKQFFIDDSHSKLFIRL